MHTWERSSYSILRVLGLPVAGHDVALLSANHELGGSCLRVVLQAATHMFLDIKGACTPVTACCTGQQTPAHGALPAAAVAVTMHLR